MDLLLDLDLDYSGHCFHIRFRVAPIVTPFLLRAGVTCPPFGTSCYLFCIGSEIQDVS